MAATDNDALLKAMDQLMKEEDRASVIEYAKQLSTKGGDVVGTMRKMSQQGVDTKKDAAMWKKRALLTAAAAVVVCAVMFGLMIASAEVTKELHGTAANDAGSTRRLQTDGLFVLNDGASPANTANVVLLTEEVEISEFVKGGRRLSGNSLSLAAEGVRREVKERRSLDDFPSRRLEDMGEITSYSRTAATSRDAPLGQTRALQDKSAARRDTLECVDGSCYVIEYSGSRELGDDSVSVQYWLNGCPKSRRLEGGDPPQPDGTDASHTFYVTQQKLTL